MEEKKLFDFIGLATPAGFEPATHNLEVACGFCDFKARSDKSTISWTIERKRLIPVVITYYRLRGQIRRRMRPELSRGGRFGTSRLHHATAFERAVDFSTSGEAAPRAQVGRCRDL
jgi:hypothetical protein